MSPVVELTAQRRGPITVHQFAQLVELGVDAVVTDRFGGVSAAPYDTLNLGDHVGDDDDAVADNRRRVASAMGVPFEELLIVSQVHGSHVVDADADEPDRVGDALLLGRLDRAVAILVADCVPVVLVAPSIHRLVLIHAGWRGLADGVVHEALRALCGPGVRVHAAVGPSISSATYQVGPEVAAAFPSHPDARYDDVGDRSRLDLRAICVSQLHAAGVAPSRIFVADAATDGGGLFFSDRHQRPCGRFALVARWSS